MKRNAAPQYFLIVRAKRDKKCPVNIYGINAAREFREKHRTKICKDIGTKQCMHNGIDFVYGYNSSNSGYCLNHEIGGIYDVQTEETVRFRWDDDGNMLSVYRPCFDEFRHHRWDESGQMVAFCSNSGGGFYGYDGKGDRVYKLTGTAVVEQYNAGVEHEML